MKTARYHRFVRFVVGGIVNTGVTWALFLVLARCMSATNAYTLTYLFGIGLAYVINSRFVFGSGLGPRTAWRYPLVYVVQYAYGLAAVDLLVERLDFARATVIAFVTVSSLPITFFLSRLLLSDRDARGPGLAEACRGGAPHDPGALPANASALAAREASVRSGPHRTRTGLRR